MCTCQAALPGHFHNHLLQVASTSGAALKEQRLVLLQEQTPGRWSAEFELQRFDWLLSLVCLFHLNIQIILNLSEPLPLQRRHCPPTVCLVQLIGQQH